MKRSTISSTPIKSSASRPIIIIDSHSGHAGIAPWINTYYNLAGDHKMAKNDPLVLEIKQWVDAEYAAGRTTVIGDTELEQVIHQLRPDLLTLRENRNE